MPVYLLAVVNPVDHPGGEFEVIETDGRMAQAASWPTWRDGPAATCASPASQRTRRRRVSDLFTELRYQYLITFEPGARPGWHPLEIRTRKRTLSFTREAGTCPAPCAAEVRYVSHRRETHHAEQTVCGGVLALARGGGPGVRDQEVRANRSRRRQHEGRHADAARSRRRRSARARTKSASARWIRRPKRPASRRPSARRRGRRGCMPRRTKADGTRGDRATPSRHAVEAASRKLVFEVTLSEDQGNFKSGKTELPDPAKARLDEVISQLKATRRTSSSRSRATRTTSAPRSSTSSSAWSAPKP